jgi:hypothetical protein
MEVRDEKTREEVGKMQKGDVSWECISKRAMLYNIEPLCQNLAGRLRT